jgi:ATP-dependent helicase/nuclease subunit B
MANEPFVDQLAETCRAEPTRTKWVIVPTHALGLTLGELLARDHCDWANLRFVTPLDLAVRMAAPCLIEQGITPSEEPLGPALVMSLLLDLPEEGGYFRPMAEHPTLAEALWRTVRELRYAGVRAGDLPATAFTSSEKHAELVALLSAYERHLDREHIADMPTVLREAQRHADWCPIAADDVVAEIPDTWWAPLVRQFLDGLPGKRLRPRTLELADVHLPARAALLAAPVDRVPVQARTDAGRLCFLQSPAKAPAPRRDGSLELFHAGGRDAEVDEVFRRILASGAPLDQVEIACASEDYALLVWEKAQRIGWRITLSAGTPALMTRPGRLLLRYGEWVGGGFASSDLRRLLQSGDCAPSAFETAFAGTASTEPDEALTPGQAARLLLKAQATWGRATYAPSLTTLGARYRRHADSSEASADERSWNARKAAQTRTLAAWIDAALASIPAPDGDNRVSLGEVAGAAIAFLNLNASRASVLDGMAMIALESALTDLVDALGGHRCDLSSALGFVSARVESVTIGGDRPRPGALHVSPLSAAGYDGRPRVFVVGLQEGGVFPSAVEDAVLLDSERQAISRWLRSSGDRLDEAVFGSLARLAAVGASADTVCLSFSCRDTRQFRDSFPSWIVLQAFRLMRGDAALAYEDLATWLGEPTSAVPASPGTALTDAGWWLAGAAKKGAARAGVLSAFPSLARGIRAVEKRSSDDFTSFDGHVPLAGPVLDSSGNGRVTSATTLERAAKCPFSYFLQEGLGVRPIDEGPSDTDVWLDPMTRGSELHELFARFMRALRAEKRAPHLKRDLDRLLAWGQERLDQLKIATPPPSDEVHARESRGVLDDLEGFLRAECEGRHGAAPVGFEVAFGFPLDEAEREPLASPIPCVVELGDNRRLVLHGRIDRINRLGPGEYEVVDYKTGGFWAKGWKGRFAGGTRLQHAIYGAAAVPLLKAVDQKARVTRGRYLFPSAKGHGRSVTIAAPSKAKLIEVLRDLTDVIGTGAFTPADTVDACKWCEVAAACHPGAVAGMASKLENADNTALEPYRRLRSHE